MIGTKPQEVVDRQDEWDQLARLWESDGSELVFVLGRRRVGKSWLLTRFAERAEGLYYQATRRTEDEQLLRLSTVVGDHFDDPALQRGVPFPDWESLLDYLTERAGDDRFAIVLDEFPYLSASAGALTSILQSYWDHQWKDRRIKLVLSGSHVTAMRQLSEADQPLYGRRTSRLLLLPFGPEHVGRFLGDAPATERFLAWAVFGGLPGNLALLDPTLDAGENVARSVLDPVGRLHDEALHALDAFVPDAEVHYSILEAIALGERTWGGITRRVGRKGGALNRALGWLVEMGLVERVVPVTESGRGRSRRAHYRITDPYTVFWQWHVAPLIASGATGRFRSDRLWKRIEKNLGGHLGETFEDACRSFVARAEGLPFEPVRIGGWWDTTSSNEIDVVALGEEGEVLAGEAKWGEFDAHDLARLEKRTDRLVDDLGRVRQVRLAVFTGRAITDPAVKERIDSKDLLTYDLNDLLRP